MKILISDPIEQVCVDLLTSEGFIVDFKPSRPFEELRGMISDYDALIVRSSTQVSSELLSVGKKLKVIGRAGAGVDNIDVDAATRRGVIVMNTPGGNTVSTAEHTMSLLLSLARNIPQANDSLRHGKWDRKKFIGTELLGKTIGVIGLGKVGREVAVRCQAFGMTTIGFDPLLSAEVAGKAHIELVSLSEVFQRSDFISVHTPLNDDTKGLLGDKEIAKCKTGVRIINCARGGIVDEAALRRGLESGKVAGAALDVFEHEPPGEHPLLKNPKVVATPHLGASTEEAQEKVARQIALQVADALKERGVSGAVNAEAIQVAMRKELQPFVALAEKLGALQAQLMRGQLRKVTIACSGSFVTQATELITAAALKGLFSHLLTEPVNLINAPVIAKEMGITIDEERESDHAAYTHLVALTYQTDVEKRKFAGTVFGNSQVRIVQIDDYHMEIHPDGCLLLYKNVDKPGMLAQVGAELAKASINIAGLALGRDKPGEKALTVMNVDSSIPIQTLQKLEQIDGVFEVRTAKL
ncbi:MAG: phosphoglycerate dehydrogenase [Ignavibacteriales bacterium]|nr:phosphoglycerate dehydrogenase [Ignavibacteriales bacterium]